MLLLWFFKGFLIDTIEQSFEKEMIQVTYSSIYCIQIRTYLLHVHFNILLFFLQRVQVYRECSAKLCISFVYLKVP